MISFLEAISPTARKLLAPDGITKGGHCKVHALTEAGKPVCGGGTTPKQSNGKRTSGRSTAAAASPSSNGK